MKKDIRLVLKPNFKKKIFEELLRKYQPDKLALILNISRGMLYHYKNNRVNNISLVMFNKILKLLHLSENDVMCQVLNTFSFKERVREILQEGKNIRKNQLMKFRLELPSLEEIISEKEINVEKWFYKYLNLINFGTRQFLNIKKFRNKLELKYTNYARGKIKTFITFIPRKIKLDGDFQYFFGLWVGDKIGGGRFGVINKEQKIITFTKKYLIKLYQNPVSVLYIGKGKKSPSDVEFSKVVRIIHKGNGYAVGVYSINGIMKSFFKYLEKNLQDFLIMTDKQIFFSGLFDAEGNIFLEDACYRWSCKNNILVEIFIKNLVEMNLFRRYDGSNLVGYNLKDFADKIFPYLKHPKKINDFNLLYFHNGQLSERFVNILKIIKDKPGITSQELAKALKRVKCYSQLNFLGKLGVIKKEGYPKKIYLTNQGVVSHLATEARTK